MSINLASGSGGFIRHLPHCLLCLASGRGRGIVSLSWRIVSWIDIEHFYIPSQFAPNTGRRGGSCSLSGPYKVLNPKFRGRSKVVKSEDPAAQDDCDLRREKYMGRSRLPCSVSQATNWVTQLPSEYRGGCLTNWLFKMERDRVQEKWEDRIGSCCTWHRILNKSSLNEGEGQSALTKQVLCDMKFNKFITTSWSNLFKSSNKLCAKVKTDPAFRPVVKRDFPGNFSMHRWRIDKEAKLQKRWRGFKGAEYQKRKDDDQ